MDSESFFIVQLFQQGSYRAALAAYSALSDPSSLLTLYAARCHLALSPPAAHDALSLLASLPPTLDSRAISALATYLAGSKEEAVEELQELLTELGDAGLDEGAGEEHEGRFVRGAVGTVWILEGEAMREEGVEILREAIELGKDQECLALLSHLYISLSLSSQSHTLLNSPSVAAFTADSLLSQLLAAQTSLAQGPTEKYQQAYYVYEEIKGMQGGRGEATLAGVAVSQGLQGRWEESGQAADEAVELNPTHPTSLANNIALALHTGKTLAVADGLLQNLRAVDQSHPFVVDLAAKEHLFDEAATKYTVPASA